jgi:hypothetical protein
LLAEAKGGLGEKGSPEDDAAPEAGWDIAYFGEVAVTNLREVFNYPS